MDGCSPKIIGGTPRTKRSKTPPRSTTPTRTRQPDPRSGSPIPTPTAPRSTPQQFLPTVQPLPKHPPPALRSTQQAPAINQPLQPGCGSPSATDFSTDTSLAPAATRMAILLSCPTITAAPNPTGSRIHHATHQHHSGSHSLASPATGVLRHAGAPPAAPPPKL